MGRNYGLDGVSVTHGGNFVFDDEDWHTIKCIAKYNSGTTHDNEDNDGRFYVEVDGVVHLDAINIYNRHPSNPRRFKTLEIFGWTQNTQAFTIDYKDVKISTGGWV